MRNSWLFFTNLDFDGGCQYIFPIDSHLYNSRYLYIPGSLALQEAFNCMSKLAGALFFGISCGSNSSLLRELSGNGHGSKPRDCQSCPQVKNTTPSRPNIAGLQFGYRRAESAAPAVFGKIVCSTIRHLWKEVEQLQSFPILSLAAALVPPFDNLSSKVLVVPLTNIDEQINGSMDRLPYEYEHQGCSRLPLSEIKWTRDAVEPRTGIKFPTVLDNLLPGGDNSSPTSEVLVGTGSRSMTVVKIKSLKVYAFGLYIHPDSVCEKLGPKYASVPINELNNRPDFLEDLLREDIHMTVRLVVNCNGLKINTVRDAFERSLRARLLKVNPETDYHCLRAFGSYFTQNTPLPVGTTIDFQRTANGQLITKIGDKQIGAVNSKELCRAFFDMYIGDVPVSAQAKQEIATNVAGIIRRC
ncbi:chalcone-flavanone isomerase family protein [Tasmannia lanceolata]|uniref:chalcone-flavanone isomerase family protein n=1 Tax=Tasmannia lanceolata TaxID=3420 RepID=UPI0040631C44